MPLNRRPSSAEEQAHIKAQHRQNTTGSFGGFLVDWQQANKDRHANGQASHEAVGVSEATEIVGIEHGWCRRSAKTAF